MLKNILKLDGAQQLSKNEQQTINGGSGCYQGCASPFLGVGSICSTNGGCHNGQCRKRGGGQVLECIQS